MYIHIYTCIYIYIYIHIYVYIHIRACDMTRSYHFHVCETIYSCVCHDIFKFVTRLVHMCDSSFTGKYIYIYTKYICTYIRGMHILILRTLIHMCDKTLSRPATRLLHTCDKTGSYKRTLSSAKRAVSSAKRALQCVKRALQYAKRALPDKTPSKLRQDSFIPVTWNTGACTWRASMHRNLKCRLIYMLYNTHSHARHDSFVCETCFIHMRDTTPLNLWPAKQACARAVLACRDKSYTDAFVCV